MKTIETIALGIGGLGIVISCLSLAGRSDPNVQIGIMISGAILFASGVIASAISAASSSQ